MGTSRPSTTRVTVSGSGLSSIIAVVSVCRYAVWVLIALLGSIPGGITATRRLSGKRRRIIRAVAAWSEFGRDDVGLVKDVSMRVIEHGEGKIDIRLLLVIVIPLAPTPIAYNHFSNEMAEFAFHFPILQGVDVLLVPLAALNVVGLFGRDVVDPNNAIVATVRQKPLGNLAQV